MKATFRINGKSIAISVVLLIILTLLVSCASNPRSALNTKSKPAKTITKNVANTTYTVTDDNDYDDNETTETPKVQNKAKIVPKNKQTANNQATQKKYAQLKVIKNSPDKQEMLVEITEIADPILSTSYQDQAEIKQKSAKTNKFAQKGPEENEEEIIDEENTEEKVVVPAKNARKLKTLHQQVEEADEEEAVGNYTGKTKINKQNQKIKPGFKQLKPKQENIIILKPNPYFTPRKKVANTKIPAKKQVVEESEESYEDIDTSLNEETE